MAAGFLKVLIVQDGFEGGLDEQGHRTVGGCKNGGLPYTYKVDPERACEPAAGGGPAVPRGPHEADPMMRKQAEAMATGVIRLMIDPPLSS